MTVDDARLAELRRIAFGRTHSPDDEARAAAARHELEAALKVADDTTPPLPEAPPVASHLEAPPVAERVEAPAEPQRARRLTWLAPTAVALVVGLLLGAGSMIALGRGIAAPAAAPTPAFTPAFTPGSSGLPPSVVPLSADQPVVGSPGDGAAALQWFDTEQVAEDVADEWIVGDNDIVATSTRLVYSMGGSKVWIAQSAQGQLCLISRSVDQGALMCATPEEFASTGIPLHVKGSLSVVWNGQRLLVSTAADPQRDVRP